MYIKPEMVIMVVGGVALLHCAALRCTCMYYIIEHVRRNMAEEVEGTSEKLRLKIRTTRRSEDVEVAPDCTVKEVG